MASRKRRALLPGAGAALTFGVVAAVLLRILPGPRRDIDYLVIGSAATLATLLVLFLIAAVAWVRDPHLFGTRRKKQP